MEMQFRVRNNDLGFCMPTTQERADMTARRAVAAQGSAAPALDMRRQVTPHLMDDAEMQEAMQAVEQQTYEQGQEALAAHTALNEQRVAQLLGLLN